MDKQINTDKMFDLGNVNPSIGAGSMVAMLFRAMEAIIDGYTPGLEKSQKTIEQAKKLAVEIAELEKSMTKAIEEYTKDPAAFKKLAKTLQSQFKSLAQTINGLPASSTKDQLLKSLKPIGALLADSAVKLGGIAQYYKDMAALENYMKTVRSSDSGAVNQFVKLLTQVRADLKLVRKLAAGIKATFPGQPEVAKQIDAVVGAANNLWNSLMGVRAGAGDGGFFDKGIQTMQDLVNKLGTAKEDKLAKIFVAGLAKIGGKDGRWDNPSRWSSAWAEVDGLGAFEAARANAEKNAPKTYTLDLSETLYLVNQGIYGKQKVPKIVEKYEDAMSGIRQVTSASTTLSNQLVTDVNKNGTVISTVISKFYQTMQQADRSVEKSLAGISGRY